MHETIGEYTSDTLQARALNPVDSYLEDMMSLVSPFAGIHNLDLSPDALSDSRGAHQLWGQLTPSDDPLASAPSVDANSSGIRSYTCEEEM